MQKFGEGNMLSKQAVMKFKKTMKKEYGQELSMVELGKQGNSLVKFFEILIKIDQRNRAKNKNGNKKIT